MTTQSRVHLTNPDRPEGRPVVLFRNSKGDGVVIRQANSYVFVDAAIVEEFVDAVCDLAEDDTGPQLGRLAAFPVASNG